MTGSEELREQAVAVLRGNDRGTWTRPSPRLYPHQWSWDSAFVAIGWAHLDGRRAVDELRSLFCGQWVDGMVPHVVFDPTVPPGSYEPDGDDWASAGHAPAGVVTSAICQPPVHALALARVREVVAARGDDAELRAVDAGVGDLYPRLVAWHRWLRAARDPDGTGLVTILHPWESGLDNSPRWDRPLAALGPVGAGSDPRNHRPDLTHVADPGERPTDVEYRHYRLLVDRLVAVGHDQARALREHPFRAADVWFSAILAASDDALADLAALVDRPDAVDGHRADAERTRSGLDAAWDADLGRCLDVDRITGEVLATDTIAGFAPLVAGCAVDRAAILVERLWSEACCGHPSLAWPLPPSTSPTDPGFDPRGYWRGPQWPPMTWLLWWALDRAGHRRSAERLRTTALDQLRTTGCCEYVHATSGQPLGSPAQSWTAAVALDWLAAAPD